VGGAVTTDGAFWVALRSPFSVFRSPFSVFRFPFSVFRFALTRDLQLIEDSGKRLPPKVK
jgi:hypothetical protein